jgi:hypothetical protein
MIITGKTVKRKKSDFVSFALGGMLLAVLVMSRNA